MECDPLIGIDSEHGLQELDTLLSLFCLNSVVFLQTHLVEETTVKSTISEVILTIMNLQSIRATMKVT